MSTCAVIPPGAFSSFVLRTFSLTVVMSELEAIYLTLSDEESLAVEVPTPDDDPIRPQPGQVAGASVGSAVSEKIIIYG